MADDVPFPGLAEFFFSFPLYAQADMAANWDEAKQIFTNMFRIDGHCPSCGKSSTFKRMGAINHPSHLDLDDLPSGARTTLEIQCQRVLAHTIWFDLLKRASRIEKVGQYPSLADIANDESRKYAKVLKGGDAAEFHRAIGLAAHGIGIGSYVYLRRIFERLVNGRFAEFKDAEGWRDEDYFRLRMDERIELLKDHLPAFLVENRKMYSILSLGIHELDEDTCRGLFPVLKGSISIILAEDEKKREERRLRDDLATAIREFTPPSKEAE